MNQEIRGRLDQIRERIARAAQRAGSKPEEITLVAATKTVPLAAILAGVEGGIRHIGENRVQEALQKFAPFRDSDKRAQTITWHFIGHLQSNKAKKAVQFFDLIQSLDSMDLAVDLDRHAREIGKVQRCLVEINVSREATKFGILLGGLGAFLDQTASLSHLRVDGLMTIGPLVERSAEARLAFAALRKAFDQVKSRFKEPVLSMGMSMDFETAIEEGSTMVRVGTALFGERRRM